MVLYHGLGCEGVTFQDSSFVHDITLVLLYKVDGCLWGQCC